LGAGLAARDEAAEPPLDPWPLPFAFPFAGSTDAEEEGELVDAGEGALFLPPLFLMLEVMSIPIGICSGVLDSSSSESS
jgi:hypothetical protein